MVGKGKRLCGRLAITGRSDVFCEKAVRQAEVSELWTLYIIVRSLVRLWARLRGRELVGIFWEYRGNIFFMVSYN